MQPILQCIVWYRCKLSGLMQCAACASVAAGVFLVLLMVDRATARKRFFCPLPLAAMAWRLRSPVFRRGEKVFQFQSLSWSIFIIMLIPLKCLAAIGTNPLGWRFLTRWNWIPFMQEWGARTLEPQSSFSKKNIDKLPQTWTNILWPLLQSHTGCSCVIVTNGERDHRWLWLQ